MPLNAIILICLGAFVTFDCAFGDVKKDYVVTSYDSKGVYSDDYGYGYDYDYGYGYSPYGTYWNPPYFPPMEKTQHRLEFALTSANYYHKASRNIMSKVYGIAVVKGYGNSVKGEVHFIPCLEKDYMIIKGKIYGLEPGKYRVVVNWYGDVSDYKKLNHLLGGYYDPYKYEAEYKTDSKEFLGDLGYINVDGSKKCHFTFKDHAVRLMSSYPMLGRAITFQKCYEVYDDKYYSGNYYDNKTYPSAYNNYAAGYDNYGPGKDGYGPGYVKGGDDYGYDKDGHGKYGYDYGYGKDGPGKYGYNYGYGKDGPGKYGYDYGYDKDGHGKYGYDYGYGKDGPGKYGYDYGYDKDGPGKYGYDYGYGKDGPGKYGYDYGYGKDGHGKDGYDYGYGKDGPGKDGYDYGYGKDGHGKHGYDYGYDSYGPVKDGYGDEYNYGYGESYGVIYDDYYGYSRSSYSDHCSQIVAVGVIGVTKCGY